MPTDSCETKIFWQNQGYFELRDTEMRTKYLRNVFRDGHMKRAGEGRITLY